MSDNQTLPRCLDHGFGDLPQTVDFEDALQLLQEAVEQPEVSVGHSNDCRHDLFRPRPRRKRDAEWRPVLLLQQSTNLSRTERAELANESERGVIGLPDC